MATEERWTVFKNYYREPAETAEADGLFTDNWPILYGTEGEADKVLTQLKAGMDKSWFDPEGNDHAGYDAVLFVDKITL